MGIIQFPQSRVVRVVADIPEVLKIKVRGLRNYANTVTDHTIQSVCSELEVHGIDTTTETFMNDISYLSEVVAQIVNRSVGIEDPPTTTTENEMPPKE